MREILFKAKRIDNGAWVKGSFILSGGYCCILQSEEDDPHTIMYLDSGLGTIDGEATPVDRRTVCQYTGLVDAYGKMIFEGDIVYVITECERGVVVYDEAAFYVQCDGFCMSFHDHLRGTDVEIIGDIHDKEGGND